MLAGRVRTIWWRVDEDGRVYLSREEADVLFEAH